MEKQVIKNRQAVLVHGQKIADAEVEMTVGVIDDVVATADGAGTGTIPLTESEMDIVQDVGSATATDCVLLPALAPVGKIVVIQSTLATKVFGGEEVAINGGTAGQKLTVAAKGIYMCVKISDAQWAAFSTSGTVA